MTTQFYKEMSKTAEGRKELHAIMLNEVKEKMNELVNKAPKANQKACEDFMKNAFAKIQTMGNADIFDYYANDQVSDYNFMNYIVKFAK